MGWKASCIFVNQREPGYLGTFPKHDPALARELVAALPVPPHVALERTNLELAMDPDPGRLFVGAYPGGAVICEFDLAQSCIAPTPPPVIRALSKHYAGAPILAITLHSVVNLYGYAYFEVGKLRRARAGTDGGEPFLGVGEPLPEELPLLRDNACGEEIVFAIADRYFGAPIDEVDIWDLEMARFTPVHPRRSFWQRWFGN